MLVDEFRYVRDWLRVGFFICSCILFNKFVNLNSFLLFLLVNFGNFDNFDFIDDLSRIGFLYWLFK